MTVVTRFAPSPTGYLHIGGVRTALFSWLYAAQQHGQFILRIEDTDIERSTQASVDAIMEGMAWLGLSADQGPFYQTERLARYRELAEQLVEQGQAYYCYCSKERLEQLREAQMSAGEKPRYDGRCQDLAATQAGDYVIRFKNPKIGAVIWEDLVKGELRIANEELDDFVIIRSDGMPTYNFAVVVDDWDMNVTHVLRGDDHVSNTPKQINLLQALNAPIPAYGHVPMILGADGKRLSKRHGAVSVLQFREQGILPQALLNYLVRLGWSFGDQEIFTIEEMIEKFSFAHISRSPAAVNPEKLLWLNQYYLKTLPAEALLPHLQPFLKERQIDIGKGPSLIEILPLFTERCQTLLELAEQIRFLYQGFETFEEAAAKKHLQAAAKVPLETLRQRFAALPAWEVSAIHNTLQEVATTLQIGMGKVGMPLRVAVTGRGQSPAIDAVVYHMGKERVLAALDRAIALL